MCVTYIVCIYMCVTEIFCPFLRHDGTCPSVDSVDCGISLSASVSRNLSIYFSYLLSVVDHLMSVAIASFSHICYYTHGNASSYLPAANIVCVHVSIICGKILLSICVAK